MDARVRFFFKTKDMVVNRSGSRLTPSPPPRPSPPQTPPPSILTHPEPKPPAKTATSRKRPAAAETYDDDDDEDEDEDEDDEDDGSESDDAEESSSSDDEDEEDEEENDHQVVKPAASEEHSSSGDDEKYEQKQPPPRPPQVVKPAAKKSPSVDPMKSLRAMAKKFKEQQRKQWKTNLLESVAQVSALLSEHQAEVSERITNGDYEIIDGDMHIHVCDLSADLLKTIRNSKHDGEWINSLSEEIYESCGMEISFDEDSLAIVLPSGDD